jgi:hypothetical protein
MKWLDRIVGPVAALCLVVAITWISNVRLTPAQQGDALLRLSWSARPERVESCHEESAEEQARLPAHMRQSVVCDGGSAAYRLQVWRDGDLVLEETVRGGGLRHDRPLEIFREIPQRTGDADVVVRLERVDPSSAATNASQRTEAMHGVSDLPPVLVFQRRLHFERGRVIVLTYDPERRVFVPLEG